MYMYTGSLRNMQLVCRLVDSKLLSWNKIVSGLVWAYLLLLSFQDAMQYRMTIQEDSVLQLKQELLRSSMDKEELAGQNVSGKSKM